MLRFIAAAYRTFGVKLEAFPKHGKLIPRIYDADDEKNLVNQAAMFGSGPKLASIRRCCVKPKRGVDNAASFNTKLTGKGEV
jgi:hypothetical protein